MPTMYELAFNPHAARGLKGLDKSIREPVLSRIEWLAKHAEEIRHEPLTARWERTYRLRVGDCRVIYGVEQAQKRIIIYAVGHRREIYKL